MPTDSSVSAVQKGHYFRQMTQISGCLGIFWRRSGWGWPSGTGATRHPLYLSILPTPSSQDGKDAAAAGAGNKAFWLFTIPQATKIGPIKKPLESTKTF